MRKLITSKLGRATRLSPILLIVALQWSFTKPGTGKVPTVRQHSDTTTVPGTKTGPLAAVNSSELSGNKRIDPSKHITSDRTVSLRAAKPAARAVPATKSSAAGATKIMVGTTINVEMARRLGVYDSLHLKRVGLSKKVFAMALKGMDRLAQSRQIKENLLTIVDFSQTSNRKRLYVIDLNTYQLVYNTYVAHGMKTGTLKAQYFSNKEASNKSSLGFYVTGKPYLGANGYSLKLDGVEKGINDRAMRRGIVIHGADYVCEGLIESQGFIGRSWGCPAVAQEVSEELINLLKEGSCLFIYHPSPAYLTKSKLIQ